jgi:methylenetetrahydrofolate--tRNA-(uracil-5-)-methyltransferase
MTPELIIIGGGLAGSEAAWQAAERGIRVRLYEMRPERLTPAHQTGNLAELVCSNSFRSNDLSNAPGILKAEMRSLGSLILSVADTVTVPAGSALAVDRKAFSEGVTAKLLAHPNIEVIREERIDISPGTPTILATGPLTSEKMADFIRTTFRNPYLFFYDAVSPILTGESVDQERVFRASRYDKGGADYLNCPMSEKEYRLFYDALMAAEKVPPQSFENIPYFEGCMPIEVMAERGFLTLAHGPMKPVGLVDPRTGTQAFAVVQLRQEDRFGQAYNMVGFQTKLKWGEQQRVFRMIPGLENAEFLRLGSIHRNTYIHAPALLNPYLQVKRMDHFYVAGQLVGVEGYLESAAMGLLAGIFSTQRIQGRQPVPLPQTTAHGALIDYITHGSPSGYQPMNIHFGLFPPLKEKIRDKALARKKIAERALRDLNPWKEMSKAF